MAPLDSVVGAALTALGASGFRAALSAAALFAAVTVPGTAAAQAGPNPGRVEGVATISRRLTTSRLRVRAYSEPGSSPAGPGHEANPLSNVVLYLSSTAPVRGPTQPGPPPVMTQHGERFVPHVLPVLVGTTVAFPNDDNVYHNVFSLSRARSLELGRYPRGSSKSIQFLVSGVVQLFCHIHADMSGYILVLDNPFFVVPDAQGHFALEGVPPGEYQLIAWHERIRPLSTPIRVEAGRTTTVRVDIPLPEPVGAR